MSLNIVDSLLDKLSFVSKDRNIPLGKKFTGSQNFLGSNSYGLSQSIPSEFTRAFMDPECLTQAHNRMNRSSSLDSKMNYFHYFEPSNDRLVSRVSKLLSPMFNPQDCFRVVPSLDILQDQEFLNRGMKVFYEEIEQHIGDMLSTMLIPDVKSAGNTSQVHSFNAEKPCNQEKESNIDSKSGGCHLPNRSSSVDSLSNQTNVLQSPIKSEQNTCYQPKSSPEIFSDHPKRSNSSVIDTCQTDLPLGDKGPSKIIMQGTSRAPLATVVVQENKKRLKNNNQAMNKELTNRKNKELQKRSKKRRRRQRKVNVILDKEHVAKAEKTPKEESKVHDRQANSSESETSDILCDITIADSASSVQILLPNSSSFVISIESAEDDSDWDSSSDSEWLTDCSEFEFSGIFISNLSAPLASTLSRDCSSQLSVPPSHAEEVEMRHLGAALRRVNKDWIESTKGLDSKPKVATKVSFAPDDELVEVLHVDIYERKGEWETYATERMRFKRRINELEKIISPCLSKEHRDKIFLSLQDINL